MAVDFDHFLCPPSLDGVREALPILFSGSRPRSLLDVGCGVGTWLKAALEFGVDDVIGLDGGCIDEGQLLIPATNFRPHDLNQPFDLARKFDVALCLEVAEHLPEAAAPVLVANLTAHADKIFFSAASPGQHGQAHINCQWPNYWQTLFNAEGYACDDTIRWKLWDLPTLDFCYRQNLFLAERSSRAGLEPRIPPVIHPEMLKDKNGFESEEYRAVWLKQVEEGSQTVHWYLSTPARAFGRKISRRFFSRPVTSSKGPC